MSAEAITQWAAGITALVAALAVPAKVLFGIVSERLKQARAARELDQSERRDATAKWVAAIQEERDRMAKELQEERQLTADLYERLIASTESVRVLTSALEGRVDALRAQRSAAEPSPIPGSGSSPQFDISKSSQTRLPAPPKVPRS